jgi:hypothetical protein
MVTRIRLGICQARQGKGSAFVISASLILLSVLAGCGYHVGSMMHPQVKSIAIAPVKNETLEPLATQFMRKQLAQQFQRDGSLSLKSLETADCILYGRILKVETTESAEASYDQDMTYRAAQWGLSIEFEYVVMIPGRKEPLVNRRIVRGTASYDVTNDHSIGRRVGLDQAAMETARKVVIYTTEAW